MVRSVTSHSDRAVSLSRNMRESLVWNQLPNRRRQIPDYVSTLRRVDLRPFSCTTCRKSFANIADMKKHVLVTHTGTKPKVCEICGKRFDSDAHRRSHYQLHKEPRLQEFGILSRRRQRQARSEGSTSPADSSTTVGTFHGVPKKKTYMWGPVSEKSFGTNQTFHVSENEHEKRRREYLTENSRKNAADKNAPAVHKTRSGKHGVGTSVEGSKQTSVDQNVNIQSVANANNIKTSGSSNVTKPSKLPQIDGGNISVVGSVMGMTKLLETDTKSHFVEHEEDTLVHARMEAASLAGGTPRQQSLKTQSAFSEPAQFRLPSMSSRPGGGRFWDTNSLASMRMSVNSTPGYDPALQQIKGNSKNRLTPSIASYRR